MGSDTVTLGPEESRHAATVLRLREGDPATLFDGAGRMAEAVVCRVARGAVCLEVREAVVEARQPGPLVTLYVAMPRAGRQQTLFEKCTELGVGRIVPLICERSTVVPKADAVSKWRRITIEAAKQCASAWLPEVRPPVSLTASTTEVAGYDVAMFGAVEGEAAPLLVLLGSVRERGDVAIWIGPEGGLTPEEMAALSAGGARPVSLGPLVLRVETAAIAAATAVMLLRESVGGAST